jgi:predicted ATPase
VDFLDPRFEKIKLRDLTYYLKYTHFLPWPEPPLQKKRRLYSMAYLNLFIQFSVAAASMTKLLNSVEYLSPIRNKGERNYTFSGESPSSVGVKGDKAGQILAADKQLRGRKRQKIDEKISAWFSQAEIGKNVSIKSLSPTTFEIRLMHPRSNESVNIADAGFGCSQILPVLVAGYFRPRNSILIIEQPEIHLHPKAQAELGTLLCDLHKRDIQLFIETHSEHLLIRL